MAAETWVQKACENLMSAGVGPHTGTIIAVSENYGFIECPKAFFARCRRERANRC